MNLILCEYVKESLKKNAIAFAFFLAGVILGVALILLVYFIYTKLKAKPPKLKKTFTLVPADEDQAIVDAKKELRALDVKVPIDVYVVNSAIILQKTVKRIASEYTGGKKYLSLDFALKEKYPDLDLSFDADFVVEDFLIFLQNVACVVENTVLTITDKYSVLVNSFLKFIGLGKSVREITLKDVVIYLNRKADKNQKKLEKAVEKKRIADDKKRFKIQKKENLHIQKRISAKVKENRADKTSTKDVWSVFRPKRKEELSDRERKKFEKAQEKERKKIESEIRKEDKRRQKEEKKNSSTVSAPEDVKTSSFYKPVNKVITEVMETLIVGLSVEARKLYGRGYPDQNRAEISKSNDGGDENA